MRGRRAGLERTWVRRGGGNGGKGEGDGQGGTGTRGGGSRQRGIPVSAVRILSIVGRENFYQLSFMADADGIARLAFEEAGDSSTVPRGDIRAVAEDASLDRVRVARGQRTVVEITSDSSIEGGLGDCRLSRPIRFRETRNEVRPRQGLAASGTATIELRRRLSAGRV